MGVFLAIDNAQHSFLIGLHTHIHRNADIGTAITPWLLK